ncbi:MAG: glycoside hydrolase family 3 N-terminal domain-containing protein [Acidimicrobiales bacterium]
MQTRARPLVVGLALVLLVTIAAAFFGRSSTRTGAGGPESGPRATTVTPTATPATTTGSTTTITTTTTDPRTPYVDSIDRSARSFDNRALAYRLVVTGLSGADLEHRLIGTVGSPCVGGVFLTETNHNWAPIDDPEAFRVALSALDVNVWHRNEQCPGPLVATDAELGAIVRVPVESPPAAPSWTERYANGEPDEVLRDLQEQSARYATTLLSLGITVNFGAVGDVDTDPSHFMAGSDRTFGDDPGIVAALSDAVVQGHCAAGLAVSLKHFPNQGATPQDPHRGASIAAGGREAWETTGRLPYAETAAPMVMTGHIFMADVDPDRPASMSYAITTGLLRDELGYEGVIITDDLSTMRGASDVIGDPGRGPWRRFASTRTWPSSSTTATSPRWSTTSQPRWTPTRRFDCGPRTATSGWRR